MKKILFILFIFSCSAIVASAQYYTSQNKVWTFAINAGLDFNSGSPVAITTGIRTSEGCASVSDSNGNLLFYTDGTNVYNKTGALMPNGSSVVSFYTGSTEQAALIIPVISNPNRYYLFSLEGSSDLLSDTGDCHLAYSIVDMTLTGGLGDVISSAKGIPLVDSLGENMIAITGDNNNIWLVTHRRDTALFLAFSITSSGISDPILSAVGNFNGSYRSYIYATSMLRASPDRRKIAQGIHQSGQYYGILLYNFDPNTGIVSNCIVIDTANNGTYGVEFSADNTKLYSNNGPQIGVPYVAQYDISLPTESAIQASKFVVTDSSDGADLRLGPDGKIYFDDPFSIYLNCISSPNLNGAACGFTTNVASYQPGTLGGVFPNLFVTTDTMNRVGIKEIKRDADQISIFPNPATTQLTIQSTAHPITQITITNLLGQSVYSWQFTVGSLQTSVDVSAFPAGMYFVQINDPSASSGQAVVRKFFKE